MLINADLKEDRNIEVIRHKASADKKNMQGLIADAKEWLCESKALETYRLIKNISFSILKGIIDNQRATDSVSFNFEDSYDFNELMEDANPNGKK